MALDRGVCLLPLLFVCGQFYCSTLANMVENVNGDAGQVSCSDKDVGVLTTAQYQGHRRGHVRLKVCACTSSLLTQSPANGFDSPTSWSVHLAESELLCRSAVIRVSVDVVQQPRLLGSAGDGAIDRAFGQRAAYRCALSRPLDFDPFLYQRPLIVCPSSEPAPAEPPPAVKPDAAAVVVVQRRQRKRRLVEKAKRFVFFP